MDHDQLRALPIGDKLDLVEWLWDEIGASDETLTLSNWVKTEAARRLDEMKANPGSGLAAEEVWRRVDTSRG